MAKIYKTTDVIPLSIDGLTVNISPLSFEQKMQVQSEVLKGGAPAAMRAAKLACQYAVKSIKGIETQDGEEYEVTSKDGMITDECWDDLQNVEQTNKIISVCLALISGVPKEFVNPETGKPLVGVSIIKEATKGKKK
jgi:hypothetical protein